MVLNTFHSFYYTPNKAAWIGWDPDLKHRSREEAINDELVDIELEAKKYPLPHQAECELDQLITEEIYQHLIGDKIDIKFLKDKGFTVIKGATKSDVCDSTRVIYHEKCPDYLIKIGKETRALPMEGNVKCKAAQRNISEESVWLPLRNQNLLRAPGKDYFVSKLEEKDKRLFTFPEEYLYMPGSVKKRNEKSQIPLHQKYFAVSKRMDIISGSKTLEIIKGKNVEIQQKIAEKIVDFIKKTRMHDLHAGNLCLRNDLKEWSFAIIDTEPLGILMDKDDTGKNLFHPTEHVLLGLINFRDRYCIRHDLTAMAEVADKAILNYIEKNESVFKFDQGYSALSSSVTDEQKYQKNGNVHYERYSERELPATLCQNIGYVVLIVLSILTLGLLPLVLLIIAACCRCCCPSMIGSQTPDHVTPGYQWFLNRN